MYAAYTAMPWLAPNLLTNTHSSLLRRHSHTSRPTQSSTEYIGHVLLYRLCAGLGQSQQDHVYWSRCGSSLGRSSPNVPMSNAQYVFALPIVQTTCIASLSHLQSMHQSNGPSLPMDEQLCGCREYEWVCCVWVCFALLFCRHRMLWVGARDSAHTRWWCLWTEHFILFLVYPWLGAASALIIFGWNYFLCSSDVCIFSVVLVQLVRAMTVICIGAVLFTSSMLMNIQYGIMTGIGTIDRLKKKAQNTLFMSEEEEVPLVDIFGIGPYWTWWLPSDPVYQDYDRIMGFSTPQRLLREQIDQPLRGGMSFTSSKGYSEVWMNWVFWTNN